jgi:phospholipid/cholesterol/gamma-HCH transport system substrate-binding protein
MANLDKIAASVQRSSDVIDKSLLKPQNIEHIDSMIASADQAAANLVELSKGLEQTRATLNQSIQKIDKMVDSNTGNVDEAMRSFRYTLDTLARYVDDIAHNADTTARNMAEFSRSIRENPGLLLGGSKQPDQTKSRDRRK